MQRFYRLSVSLVIIGLVIVGLKVPISAAVPYPSFSFDAWGQPVVSPAPYEPILMLDGFDIRLEDPWSISGYAIVPFSQPQGLAVDSKNHLYIADAGNNRIVEYDDEFNYLRSIGDSSGQGRLSRPQGVFVHEDGRIFVADTGNSRVAVFSPTGEFMQAYGRPDSQIFGVDYRFAPVSLVVDHRGSLFIVTEGGYRGLVQLSESGEFLGFIGGNQAGFDLMWVLKQIFFTEEQLGREKRRLPGSPSFVTIDQRGQIYTATISTSHAQVKRFNLGGINTLPERDYGAPYFRTGVSMFNAVAVDPKGIITAVDANTGQIFQYTPNGDKLFVFGGRSIAAIERMGLINQAAGLAIRSDGLIIVSDSRSNTLHVFKPTEFAQLVHEAVYLFEDGRYDDSAKYWEEVLRRNSNFDFAHRGLGMAAYQNEEFETAMDHFYLAQYADGYSDAFWWARRAWLLNHFDKVLIILAAVWVVYQIVNRVYLRHRPRRKRDWYRVNRLLGDLMHAKTVIFHPSEGFYDVRWSNKGSWLSACVIVLLAFATKLFSLYYTNLIFMSIDRNRINLGIEAMTFILPWVIWVIGHYLISALKEGEGRFKDVFIASAYCLVPYIVIMLPLTLISNVMTNYEAPVYHFFQNVAVIWSAILFFVMVYTIHNYEIFEAIPNCILSVLMMVVIGAIGGLVIGMTFNVSDFAVGLYKEVIYRVF